METREVTLEELEPGSLVHLNSIKDYFESVVVDHVANKELLYIGASNGRTKFHAVDKYGRQMDLPTVNLNNKTPLKQFATNKSYLDKLQKRKEYVPQWYVSVCIGTDPEIFASNSKGTLIPAWEYLPDRPTSRKRAETSYWDGFQAEFNTDPRFCLLEHGKSLQDRIISLIDKLHLHNRLGRLMPNSVVDVNIEDLANLDSKYMEFGCKPSINVYGDIGEAVDAPLLPYRFAGGHIHAGIGKLFKPQIRHIVAALDGLCALPCVGIAASIDSPIRRRFYGKAGEIRLPTHGLEYRVLSNFWMMSPPLTHIVHELFRRAFRFGMNGMYPVIFKTPQEEVRRIINECDVTAARNVVQANKALFEHLFAGLNIGTSDRKYVFDLINKGAEYVLPCMDVNKNWLSTEITKIAKLSHSRDIDSIYYYGAGGYTWQKLTQMLDAKSVQPVMA